VGKQTHKYDFLYFFGETHLLWLEKFPHPFFAELLIDIALVVSKMGKWTDWRQLVLGLSVKQSHNPMKIKMN